MKILIIDTSYLNHFSIGIFNEDKIYSSYVMSNHNSFTSFWSELDKILKISKTNKKELDVISVSIGPGPFTSLRNGISIARTLSQILKIKIVKFSLVEVIEKLFSNSPLKPTILFDGRAKKFLIKKHTSTKLELIKIQEFQPQEGEFVISVGCKDLIKNINIINFEYIPIPIILDFVKSKIQNQEFSNFNEVLPIYYKHPI